MLNVKLFQILVLSTVLALLGMLAVACGSEDEPDPTAAPAATQAPAPTTASDGEVFELKYSSPLSPPPFLISEVQKWWADTVAERSNGRIVWTDFYWSGALTKAGETLEAVQVGLADAGMVALPYYPGKLPLEPFRIQCGRLELALLTTHFSRTALDGYHEHTAEKVFQTAALCESMAAYPGKALLYSADLFLPHNHATPPDSRPTRRQWQARARFEADGYRELQATRVLLDASPQQGGAPVVDGSGFLPIRPKRA